MNGFNKFKWALNTTKVIGRIVNMAAGIKVVRTLNSRDCCETVAKTFGVLYMITYYWEWFNKRTFKI